MTTDTFTTTDIHPTDSAKDAARLLASLIGEPAVYCYQSQGGQAGPVSINNLNGEVTLTRAAVGRLLGAIRRSLAEAAKDGYEFGSDQGRPYLALNEVDAVEVFDALSKTAQVYATFGDPIMSAHFADLYSRLVNAPKGA